jgi:hypothetical protein
MHALTLFAYRSISLLAVVASSGCAGLLTEGSGPSAAERDAGPAKCFRSYLLGASRPNPGASAKVAAWYASLTPKTVVELAEGADASEFQDRVMRHAVAAGVGEGEFLRGSHPDPVDACGVAWNHEDVGAYRFQNAASAAKSVLRRDAFAACAREFDELAPKLAALAKNTRQALAALPSDANPYDAWSTYHRAMSEQRAILPLTEGKPLPVLAYAGAPYVAFTDMFSRFGAGPLAFLEYHWLGGAWPFPDDAQRFIQPLETPTDDAKLLYCARKLRAQGPLYSDFSEEDISKIFAPFDGQAWLDAQPTKGAKHDTGTMHIAENDLRPGLVVDHDMGGKEGPDKEKFRLYQRTITVTALKDGKGTVELTQVEKLRRSYDCKAIAKVTRNKDGSATVEPGEVCKYDDTVVTSSLTLSVDLLPAGLRLAAGDEILFFAERTAKDERTGSKPSAAGLASFRTTSAAAKLLFLARARRGSTVVYPSSN